MSSSRGLYWVIIIYTKTIFIVAWFSSYNFDGVHMVHSIDLYNFLIHLWSNTSVYIAIVYFLELLRVL